MEVCQQLALPGPDRAYWNSRPVNSNDYRTVTIIGVTPTGPGSWYCRANVETVNMQTGQINQAETGIYEYEGALGPYCTPHLDDPKPQKPPSCTADPSVGKPIFPLTGAERYVQPLSIRIGWENLSITFDSTRRLPTAEGGPPLFPKPYNNFTELWESNVHKRLIPAHFNRGMHALRGENQIITFKKDNFGLFFADSDVSDALWKVADGFRYFDASRNAVESYSAEGYLLRIDKNDGRYLIFTNSDAATPLTVAPGPGYPLSIQDQSGRSVSFGYAGGRVVRVVDAAGLAINFIYDANNPRLDGVEWQDGTKVLFPYTGAPGFFALAGVVDENGARHATVSYDAYGRAVSTELAGGVNRYEVTYQAPPVIQVTETGPMEGDPTPFAYRTQAMQAPEGTSVKLPTGASSAWAALSVAGAPSISSQSQAAGSGCAPSGSSVSLDWNRNLAFRDDFNNVRTCYVHDHRNLETVRVEGLAVTAQCGAMTASNAVLPAGSRKMTTVWHPDWRLQTQRFEPHRKTTSVYNGQLDPFTNAVASCAPATAKLPDGKPIAVLCKQVEQATTDANGSLGFNAPLQAGVPARETKLTYNQYGQVLSEDGPRTDVADVTKYEYYTDTTADHTLGDLKQVTNALGKVTRYTKYNKHGQVLESIDPNAVLTVNTYDLRQRLLSTSVGGQKTSYTYDAVGQLKRITQPNASWIGFDYDDAHRQVAVYDNKGNRIEYTLDDMGNRKVEQVKDPAGVLKRQLGRSIDALGRVQQVTGRE